MYESSREKLRELNFEVKEAKLLSFYGSFIKEFRDTTSLPINTNKTYYESNLGILYIHNGEGKLDLTLALKPLLYLKQALLHTSFLDELDKALIGERYNPVFTPAIKEFELIYDYNFENNNIENKDFKEIVDKLIARIS